MAVILWAMGLCLLMQGYLCSLEQTTRGCMKWTQSGRNVCCEICHPGNRLLQKCGPDPKALCAPCEAKTFTVKPLSYKCDRCTQCVGAQILVKECIASTDTKCGCKAGLTCGNADCNFCVKTCGKGEEPTANRSCKACPEGTFNDQIHQKCKPWSTKCPNPSEDIVVEGNAFTDIQCVKVGPVTKPGKSDNTEQPQQFNSVIIIVVATALSIGFVIIFVVVIMKKHRKPMPTKKPDTKTPIGPPTEDPRTLIAIECSFHEAQQEQGSSSESLASKDSSEQLIGCTR